MAVLVWFWEDSSTSSMNTELIQCHSFSMETTWEEASDFGSLQPSVVQGSQPYENFAGHRCQFLMTSHQVPTEQRASGGWGDQRGLGLCLIGFPDSERLLVVEDGWLNVTDLQILPWSFRHPPTSLSDTRVCHHHYYWSAFFDTFMTLRLNDFYRLLFPPTVLFFSWVSSVIIHVYE